MNQMFILKLIEFTNLCIYICFRKTRMHYTYTDGQKIPPIVYAIVRTHEARTCVSSRRAMKIEESREKLVGGTQKHDRLPSGSVAMRCDWFLPSDPNNHNLRASGRTQCDWFSDEPYRKFTQEEQTYTSSLVLKYSSVVGPGAGVVGGGSVQCVEATEKRPLVASAILPEASDVKRSL